MQSERVRLPPLSRLRPFEAAARLESFSRAALELGMTQTAVSKQIAQLERELEIKLFERRNRGVYLTEPGRRLGRVVSEALAGITTEMAALRGERRGRELVLHCQLCEAFYWLMPRLVRFHEANPGVELRVVTSERPITEATEHFDVAIQTSGRPSGTARLVFTAADEVFPVCAPSLLRNTRAPLEPEELVRFPLLSHQVVPQDWMEWSDWLAAVGVRLSDRPRLLHFDSYPMALQAAISGHGVALGWRRATEALIADGKLVRPCLAVVFRPTEISVFQGTAAGLHPDANKLLAWLAEELSEGFDDHG